MPSFWSRWRGRLATSLFDLAAAWSSLSLSRRAGRFDLAGDLGHGLILSVFGDVLLGRLVSQGCRRVALVVLSGGFGCNNTPATTSQACGGGGGAVCVVRGEGAVDFSALLVVQCWDSLTRSPCASLSWLRTVANTGCVSVRSRRSGFGLLVWVCRSRGTNRGLSAPLSATLVFRVASFGRLRFGPSWVLGSLLWLRFLVGSARLILGRSVGGVSCPGPFGGSRSKCGSMCGVSRRSWGSGFARVSLRCRIGTGLGLCVLGG